jgi:hypothetical protein
MSNQTYREAITDDIHDCIAEMQCRPILFVGAGISRRYLHLPDWRGLLDLVRKECPLLERELPYYIQRENHELPAVASYFATQFQEFAWSNEGRNKYPEELFQESSRQDVYLKYSVKRVIEALSESNEADHSKSQYAEEISDLQQVKPFAVVSTNYDTFLESIFEDFQVTIGESILRADLNKIGDLLKIHGCISKPSSIVLTDGDYQEFNIRQRYLAAKLLTYFLEHPVVFLGYSVTDPNIRELLGHIDLVLGSSGECIANIFLVNYSDNEEGIAPRDTVLSTGDNRNVRVKFIETSDFSWVYKAFSHQAPVEFDVRTLRSLESQIKKIVRTEYNNGTVQVDYQSISSLSDGQPGKLTVVGLTPIVSITQSEIHFRHNISAVAEALGFSHWYSVNKLIEKIEKEKGVNIKKSDNLYHQASKYGANIFHKYSDDFIELLKKVSRDEYYELQLDASPDSIS